MNDELKIKNFFMWEVIPTINESNFAEVKRKAEVVFGWPEKPRVQIDVADPFFGDRLTWGDPRDMESLPDLDYEIHLMRSDTDDILPMWLQSRAKRIYFHLEVTADPVAALDVSKQAGKEAGLAILHTVSKELIFPILDKFSFWMVLAVSPGPSGQEFSEEALDMVRFIKEKAPEAKVEVDGGMNLESAMKVRASGADAVAAASFIFSDPNPYNAYLKLNGVAANERGKN